MNKFPDYFCCIFTNRANGGRCLFHTFYFQEFPVVGKMQKKGREPWSSGYGRRLMFVRSWVQIPALYTGGTFFHIDLL